MPQGCFEDSTLWIQSNGKWKNHCGNQSTTSCRVENALATVPESYHWASLLLGGSPISCLSHSSIDWLPKTRKKSIPPFESGGMEISAFHHMIPSSQAEIRLQTSWHKPNFSVPPFESTLFMEANWLAGWQYSSIDLQGFGAFQIKLFLFSRRLP